MVLITPEHVIIVVKFVTSFSCCWPPSPNASKWDIILLDARWIFAMCLSGHGILQCVQGILQILDDPLTVTRTTTEVGTVILGFIKMAVCRYHRGKLQVAVVACENFLKNTSPHGREIMQACIDKCLPSYIILGVSFILAWAAFATGSLYMEEMVKVSEIEYVIPKWAENFPRLNEMIYATEVIVITFVLSTSFVDFQVGLLLWYTGTEFQLLSERFLKATNSDEFDECIREHQRLLKFVENVIVPARQAALSVTGVQIFGTICCAYQLLSPESAFRKLRFALLLTGLCLEVLMYTWPSDYLKSNSVNVADAAFYSPWIKESQAVPKRVYFVMMRAQKAVTVHIDGLLPPLDMEFYGSFLTTAFSYFTTLRTVTSR